MIFEIRWSAMPSWAVDNHGFVERRFLVGAIDEGRYHTYLEVYVSTIVPYVFYPKRCQTSHGNRCKSLLGNLDIQFHNGPFCSLTNILMDSDPTYEHDTTYILCTSSHSVDLR